ncbi:MAG: phage tail protein [Methylocystaceae bacterium]
MTDQKYCLYRTILQSDSGITEPITSLCSGPFGLLFLLDQATNLWLYDFLNHQTTLLLKEGHGLFSSDTCMQFAANTLFVLDYSRAAIIAISASNGQILWINREFYGGDPLTMAANETEQLFVITVPEYSLVNYREQSNVTGEIPLEILKVTFDGQVRRLPVPSGFHLSKPISPVRSDRVVASSGREGKLYVMDSLTGQLWIFTPDGNLIDEDSLSLPSQATGLGVDNDGNVYTAVSYHSDTEDSKRVLRIGFTRQETAALAAYHGNIDQLWVDQNNQIYIWDRYRCLLSILERQEGIRFDHTERPHGVYVFPVMDSTVPEMEWHRINLDADIPDDTQIRLSYFSNDNQEVVIDDQLINIEACLADQSLPLHEKLGLLEPLWIQELINPQDMLLPSARGRYLWVKVELIGSESRTPVLKKVRIYFPRMSLLSYLPAVYQEDKTSRDFLERFLSLFDTFLQGMEEQIDQVSKIFDPEAASGPFLNWLASWLDLRVDENWSEQQIRCLLMAAPSLYKMRGTRQGMEEIIAIYTGERPFIVEHFQYKYLQEIQEIKDIMSQLYGQNPYGFTILVKQDKVPTSAQLATLQKIIDEEKPAFTEANLVVLQPWMYMDMHSYLGINTYLSELSLLRLDNKSSMPFSSVIVDRGRDNRFDTHSRMELDAHLK